MNPHTDAFDKPFLIAFQKAFRRQRIMNRVCWWLETLSLGTVAGVVIVLVLAR